MLRLPSFEYAPAGTLADAVRMLGAAGPQAEAMAGGTDLLPHMKRRQRAPALVVGLRGIAELQGISATADGGLRLGAGSTLAQAARHPLVREYFPALAGALGEIASPAIREMGTIGGNLCIETRCRCFDLPALAREGLGHCLKDGGSICQIAPRSPRCWAVMASDAAPILMAMGARVRLISARAERVIPLHDLYRADGLRPLTLAADELITDILLPPPGTMRVTYYKMRVRGAIDFAAIGAAAMVRRAADGTVTDAGIVLGAVASAPLVAGEAASLLVGRRLDGDAIRDAAQSAGRLARPLENADLTANWRKRMVAVATSRALQRLAAA